MHIHEYQAKALFADFGIPVPRGAVATTVEEGMAAYAALDVPVGVVKAQIHAGGRGKGGGVRVCRSAEAVREAAEAILGMRLVTHQTGPEGKLVHAVLVEAGTDIAKELYAAVVLDRPAGRLAVMVSPDGGMDIETVAASTPDRVYVEWLDAAHSLWPYQGRRLLSGCGLNAAQMVRGLDVLQRLVRLAVEKDATLVEVNPLVLTVNGELVALDAKLDFDDSALFRHPDIAALADPQETDALEQEAVAAGLNYVRLSGSVGTLVNGAGLAMATMDAIKQAGAEPANFLDVGGGAQEETVAAGFRIMLRDPHVRGVLINIFGGILRCDVVAKGVVNAVRATGMNLPLVVRLEGTNVAEGRRILAESGLNFTTAQSMTEAAQAIVTLVQKREMSA